MRAVLAIVLLGATPARAHELTASTLAASWTFDPWVMALLYGSALLYWVGTRRVWRRAGTGRGLRQWQVACFWTGWTLLALALTSPLHWLGERLFVAHMIEHTILMALAAPLIAVSRPVGAVMWGLPPAVRRGLGRWSRSPRVAALWAKLCQPLTATIVQAVALWAWHIPALYVLVLTSPLAHRLQHFSFTASALLFWWSLAYGPARRHGYGANVLYLFATALHSGILGALLATSRRLWVPPQVAAAAEWGLTPWEDQQLAGLVMWVPMGLIYTAAALVFAAKWIEASAAAKERVDGALAR